jgi:hypothetical protein
MIRIACNDHFPPPDGGRSMARRVCESRHQRASRGIVILRTIGRVSPFCLEKWLAHEMPSRRDRLHLYGLFQNRAHSPDGGHRHVSGIAADGDRDQGWP